MRTVKTIVGLATAILLTAVAPAGADILPVGSWSFNEDKGAIARDSSGHHNEGHLEGLAQWAPGRFQSAIDFNGNAAAVEVQNSSSLESGAISVSAWVNSSGSPGDYRYIVAKGAEGCQAASYGLYTGANGGLEFYVASNTGLSWTPSPDAGQGIWDGQWHNVVGTYNGSSVKLYVDGREVGSGTPDTAPIAYGLYTSNNLLIGDYAGCSGTDFSGSIDEVKVFDRALSQFEIGTGYGLSHWLPPGFPFDLVL